MRFWQLFENMSPSDIETVRIFAEKALSRYNIDKLEFTQHFVQRAIDERNRPKIKMAELLRFFKRHAKFNGKKYFSELDPWQQIILKDLKTDIIVVVNVKKGQKENSLKFVCATIQRKENYGHTIQNVFVIEDLVEKKATDISPVEKGKKIKEGGVGRITKQNQTRDVGPDEVKKQAAKFGNTVDRDGRPPTLSKKTKGKSTNVLYNLGLAESVLDELNIPRNQMPQISMKDLKGNYDLESESVDPGTLETSQDQRIPGMVDKTVQSIKDGFDKPLVIDKNGFIVNGHHRYDAYMKLGMSKVPVIRVKDATIQELIQNFSHTAKDTYAEDNEREIGIHRSSEDFAVIDLSKSADGTFWLNGVDNTDWDSTVTTGKGVEMAFEISPRAKLASYDDIDKYSTGELENMGYDGVRMVDGDNISYQIWNTQILKRTRLGENFADGKKKGKSRPGRFKKAGVSCKGSVTDLRKKAKNSSGEKQKGYHWCANMKSGRKKS